MTIAGCYARKSNDEPGKDVDAKSVTRQIDRTKQYAAQKGWRFDDAHIYSDDGISGAEFKKRPGLTKAPRRSAGPQAVVRRPHRQRAFAPRA